MDSDDRSPKGDKPRAIVVCAPSEAAELQRSLVKQGTTDVLVKPDKLIEPGNGYVINPSVLELPPFDTSWFVD